MKQLPILIRREFWENRNLFMVLPLVITAFTLLIFLLIGVASISDDANVEISVQGDVALIENLMAADNAYEYGLLYLAGQPDWKRAGVVRSGLMMVAVTPLVVVWIVSFFYLLGCLYNDRRDRSILFWKSMPVSDRMTVISKCAAGLLAAPLVYLACVVALQLTGLLLMSLNALGTDFSAIELVWAPASYPGLLLTMALGLVFMMLWYLPLFGWLLVVSACARSVPIVWAIGLPIVVSILESIVTRQARLADWMSMHAVPSRLIEDNGAMVENMKSLWATPDMASAIVIGGLLVTVAIWLRGKADEI